jgi:four helix bundle protein
VDEAEFKRRTMAVGLEILALCDSAPRKPGAQAIVRQLTRSATSVGANYRAACRARSVKDLVYKLGIVEEEADESGYWLELLAAGGYLPVDQIAPLQREMNEIVAMTVASRKTLRRRLDSAEGSGSIPHRKSPNRKSIDAL